MPPRATCCQLLAALLVLLTGCGDNSTPSSSDGPLGSAPAASPAGATPEADVRPPADKSLTLAQYIQAGMPAHDRSWTAADMATATDVLNALALKDTGHLPRYQSERSGKAFARLTADGNLDFYRNRALPITQRLPDAIGYMQSNLQILNAYTSTVSQQAVGGSEVVELVGAQLRIAVVMIQLVNEFLPTLDKNDPTYPTRLEGLKKMRNGFAITIAGTLEMLTESHTYRTSELKRLIGYLRSTLPDILPELPAGSRAEVRVRLRSFLDDPKMQHLKPELTALADVAGQSVATENAP